MNALLIVTLVACVCGPASALFVQPSVYGTPNADQHICFDNTISFDHSMSFFHCANEGVLHITKCTLELATRKTCPLSFTGTNEENKPSTCSAPQYLGNSDCTHQLMELCNSHSECAFNWNQLPNLQCIDPTELTDAEKAKTAAEMLPLKLREISNIDQQIHVEYRCQNKRNQFRPFGNKRYDRKFSRNMAQPLRKLSYNRLQQL